MLNKSLWAFKERWRIRAQSFKYRPWRKCENVCGWAWPYGFVPEAGCPIHDPDYWSALQVRDHKLMMKSWFVKRKHVDAQ